MATWEIAVTGFLWGLVAGFILDRGLRTGRWSLWP